jgi:hypothetical protein
MEQKAASPACPICGHPVPLEECKTDECGRAVHGDCYAIKVMLENGASRANGNGKYLDET